MPLANTQSQVTYAGNGATVDFATTFAFLANAHLLVEQRTGSGAWSTKTEGVHYTVAGAGAAEPGGTVTMLVAPPSNDQLRITRNTPITQQAELQTSGPLPSKTIIQVADKLTMVCQELARRATALEAGTAAVTLASSQVTDTFTASDPIENTFPRVVSCSGTPAIVIPGRIENLTTPSEVLRAEGLLWSTPASGSFKVEHLEGLTPGQQYRIRYLVLT